MNWIALIGLIVSFIFIVHQAYLFTVHEKPKEKTNTPFVDIGKDKKVLFGLIGLFIWCLWSLYLSGDFQRFFKCLFWIVLFSCLFFDKRNNECGNLREKRSQKSNDIIFHEYQEKTQMIPFESFLAGATINWAPANKKLQRTHGLRFRSPRAAELNVVLLNQKELPKGPKKPTSEKVKIETGCCELMIFRILMRANTTTTEPASNNACQHDHYWTCK